MLLKILIFFNLFGYNKYNSENIVWIFITYTYTIYLIYYIKEYNKYV